MWPNSTPKLSRSASLNLAYDGNSLLALPAGGGVGAGVTTGVSGQADALIRSAFSTVTSTNVAIGGQTTRKMDGLDGGSASDIDAAFVAGVNNVLVLWETTNAVYAGRTAAQAAADMQSYIANRLAAHAGWRIVVLSTIPRQYGVGGSAVQADINALNASLYLESSSTPGADQIIRDNLRAWGGKTFVDLRCSGSPFRFADYAAARFQQDGALWNETSDTRTHLTPAGYAFVAGLVARAVFNLQR